MLDIARDRRKTLKKEIEKRKMRKSQTTTINIFLLSIFHFFQGLNTIFRVRKLISV